MTIIEIKDCVRKDVPIYYRRVYTGVAVLEIVGKIQDAQIDWIIETSPFGTSEVSVNVTGDIDYPLVPLVNELKTTIMKLDAAGLLPL